MTMIGDKIKVTATMDGDLVEWIDDNIKSRRFASRSHALEFAVAHLMDEDKTEAKVDSNESPLKASVTA